VHAYGQGELFDSRRRFERRFDLGVKAASGNAGHNDRNDDERPSTAISLRILGSILMA
jgi:hypothetical protein